MTTNMVQGTASQQASAELHLERRAEWRYYRVDGVRYVALASGRSGKVYRVRADGTGCSCAAYQIHGYAACSHMIAVRRSNDRPAIREVRGRYADLFPSCLCGDLADGLDGRCSRCASDKEWNERRTAQAAARRA